MLLSRKSQLIKFLPAAYNSPPPSPHINKIRPVGAATCVFEVTVWCLECPRRLQKGPCITVLERPCGKTRVQWSYIPAYIPEQPLRSDLWLEFTDLKYLHSHMHIPYMAIRSYYSLQAALDVKFDLRFEISEPQLPTYPCAYCLYSMDLLAASEATKAGKQPQRSNLTSDLKSVTSITYISMCILLLWCGPFWQPPRLFGGCGGLWGCQKGSYHISNMQWLCGYLGSVIWNLRSYLIFQSINY